MYILSHSMKKQMLFPPLQLFKSTMPPAKLQILDFFTAVIDSHPYR